MEKLTTAQIIRLKAKQNKMEKEGLISYECNGVVWDVYSRPVDFGLNESMYEKSYEVMNKLVDIIRKNAFEYGIPKEYDKGRFLQEYGEILQVLLISRSVHVIIFKNSKDKQIAMEIYDPYFKYSIELAFPIDLWNKFIQTKNIEVFFPIKEKVIKIYHNAKFLA